MAGAGLIVGLAFSTISLSLRWLGADGPVMEDEIGFFGEEKLTIVPEALDSRRKSIIYTPFQP